MNKRNFSAVTKQEEEEEEEVEVKDLPSQLEEEIEHQKSELDGTEKDEDYEEAKSIVSKSFKIHDKPGVALVTLTRTFKSENITVSFDCTDEDHGNVEDGYEEDYANAEEPDESPVDSYGINFTVEIEKKGSVLRFDCVASESLVINHVSYHPKDVDNKDTLYGGPEYEHLAEGLKESFTAFLAERKIDDDLRYFVVSHARYKDEQEYFTWLKNLSDFVSK